MKVLHVNRAFSSTFQITDDRILGRSIFQLDGGQWDLPVLHELLDERICQSSPAAHVEIEQHLTQVGRKVLRMTASRFAAGSERKEAVLLVMSDVTEERVLEEANRRQDQECGATHGIAEARSGTRRAAANDGPTGRATRPVD